MPTAQSKIELILELKNKMRSGLANAKKNVSSLVSDLKGQISNLKESHLEAFKQMGDSVPQFGNLMKMAGNPYALIAAGTAVLIQGTVKLFNHLMDVSLAIEAERNAIRGTFDATGAELTKLTSISSATQKVFQVDAEEMRMAVNALTREYKDTGMTAENAFRLVQKGLMQTGGKIDLDQIKEYSTQMKAAGVNAEQFINIMAQAYKLGIYQDKAVDTIKEGNLQLSEMPKAAADALEKLKKVKGVTFNVDELKKSLKTGKTTTFEAMIQISANLNKLDVSAKQEVIANLFGAPGEDAGAQLFKTILGSKNAMEGLANAQDINIKKMKTRLRMEEQLATTVQQFSGKFKGVNDQVEQFKLQAQIIFYDLFNKSIPFIEIWIARFKQVWLGFIQPFKLAYNLVIGQGKAVWWLYQQIWKLIDWVYNKLGGEGSLFEKIFGGADGVWEGIKSFFQNFSLYLDRVTQLATKAFETINYAVSGQWGKMKESWGELKTEFAKGWQIDETLKAKAAAAEEDKKKETQAGKNPATGLTGGGGMPGTGAGTPDVTKITGATSAAAPKSITINIGSFVEQMTLSEQSNEGMTKEQIERWFMDMMMRTVNHAEMS